MKKQIRILIIISCIVSAVFQSFSFAGPPQDPWKKWLIEISPILTDLERSVIKLLKTEEERTRFKELFWKCRDSNPETPNINEFQVEYYRRLDYAQRFLGGIQTDRGKIYVVLGPPTSKSNFAGQEPSVDSEVWVYEGLDKPDIPPFINLVFFRPRNMGEYQLYYPGINRPKDLLSPQYYDKVSSLKQAYSYLKQNSSILARASLSLVPSEADPSQGISSASSNLILNQIASLPERETNIGYVKGFLSLPTGSVQVSHSTSVIRGYGNISVAWNKGIPFVHYALMPDVLIFKASSKDFFEADILLNISIEDMKGSLVFQDSKTVDLKVDSVKKKNMDDRRIVFRDFAPVIEGDYHVITSFTNKTTGEFFTYEENISVPKIDTNTTSNVLLPLVGFQLKETESTSFNPYSADIFSVLIDPRNTFSQKDAIEGIVLSDTLPEIFLESSSEIKPRIPVQPETTGLKQGELTVYKFRKPLSEIKDGNYYLAIRNSQGKTFMRKIHILPFYIEIKRPFGMEKPEPASSRNNYLFIQGQECMAAQQFEQAITLFNRIPHTLWNASSIPVIAEAYYKKGDYAKTLELLEHPEVKKEYPILTMLANSSIELKLYQKALTYLEQIRNYGDTVEINQLIASTYILIGNREKANFFYERAKELKLKKDKLQDNKKQETNNTEIK